MKKSILFIAVLVTFSCKSKIDSAEKGNTNIENTTMDTSKTELNDTNLIAKGNLYGSGEEGIEAQNLVITNQKDWDELIAQMDSVNKVSTGFSETTIDFSKHSIIAVFDEVKTSGGHSLELNITTNSENTLVDVNHISPKGNATSVMTQPYYIIKIYKNDLPTVFK